jgi:hypothetical protein
MKPDPSRLKQLIRELEDSRMEHLRLLLQEPGLFREGSLVTVSRKCGKPNCRCANGEGHPTLYLSTKEAGKTRMIYVSGAIAAVVAEEANNYRRFRKHRAFLVKLAKQSLQLIDRLQVALQTKSKISAKRRPRQGKQ